MRLDVKKYFEEALQIQWIRSLTQSREFELQPLNPACIPRIERSTHFSQEAFCVVPTQLPTFEYRRFVRHHVFQTEVYLTEPHLPLPVFRFHFQIVNFGNIAQIRMNMEMCIRQLEATNKDVEDRERSLDHLGNPKSAWLRLMGLPPASKPEIVDVWHQDGVLPARIAAQTKFTSVHPQVHIQSRSDFKSELDDIGLKEDRIMLAIMQESDSDVTDEEQDSIGANEEDGREVEELNLDTKNRSSTLRRQKRSTKATSNDLYHPVTPDVHVNSPSSNAPLVVLSLVEEEEPKQQPISSLDVHFFRKKKSASLYREPLKIESDPAMNPASPRAFQGAPYAISPEQEKCKPLFPSSWQEKDPLLTALATRAHDELTLVPSRLHPSTDDEQAYDDRYKATRYRDAHPNKMLLHSKSLHLAQNAKAIQDFLSYGLHPGFKRHHIRKEERRMAELLFEKDKDRMLCSMEEYKLTKWKSTDEESAHQCRDWLLTLGLHLACSDALVGWDQSPHAIRCWQTASSSSLGFYGGTHSMRLTAMGNREKRIWSDRLACYINEYQASLASNCIDDETEEGAASLTSYMSLSQYFASTTDGMTKNPLCGLSTPTFTFANASDTFELPVYAVAEWCLRDLHPVSVPKNVNYVIICPQSRSEWLATLTLSYIASLKQQYTNAHLGTQKGIEMKTLYGDLSVSVDHGNSMLLLNASPKTSDPFESFRVAATKLHTLLYGQAPPKDNTMSTVIYVVAPFRRGDIMHKCWLLGSLGYGLRTGNSRLCIEESPQQLADSSLYRGSVTIALVYLEDLYDTCIEANPFSTLPACFGLFDRITESVQLTPMSNSTHKRHPTRHIAERLYHLGTASKDELPVVMYGAYTYTSTGFLLCSCVDPLGSVCEVFAITTACEDNEMTRIRQAFGRWLDFFALFGNKGLLVITNLYEQEVSKAVKERELWRQVLGSEASSPSTLSLEIVYIDVLEIPRSRIQLCDRLEKSIKCLELNQKDCRAPFAWDVVFADDTVRGYLVLSSTEPAHHHGSHSQLARSTAIDRGSACYERPQDCPDYRDDIILEMKVQMHFPEDRSGTKGERKKGNEAMSKVMHCVLRDFASLSYMTIHPVTLVRQSPYPLHVAALDKLKRETITLTDQISGF